MMGQQRQVVGTRGQEHEQAAIGALLDVRLMALYGTCTAGDG